MRDKERGQADSMAKRRTFPLETVSGITSYRFKGGGGSTIIDAQRGIQRAAG
jgi:hypothetical protein